MPGACLEGDVMKMKTIYVLTRDYRSYTIGIRPVEPHIDVDVPDNFSGGPETYHPDTQEWIPDELKKPK
ncbi:hypothetical protein Xhom_05005 [Xenorhabdus hominickii]|uniref:Uncharacterized protein n=1 Tax=Xenorhabdus hominickii TaxID=351679 RepID=A0A2G0PS72_XENHO|nr:hypothetical protein Xhom_05005 [Xenorhabdus hominickii]